MRSKYEKITVRHKDEIIIKLIEVLEHRNSSPPSANIDGEQVELLKWVLSIDDDTLQELLLEKDSC